MTASYLSPIFERPHEVLEEAKTQLPLDEIDLFVGTGLSGGVAAALFGYHFDRPFAVARKHDDNSCHSSNKVEGLSHLPLNIEVRWVFIDDLIASGRTFDRVKEAVQDLNEPSRLYIPPRTFRLIGHYLYTECTGFHPVVPEPVQSLDSYPKRFDSLRQST